MDFDWWDAIELIVAAIVGYVVLEYHANFPTTSWMRLILTADMCGELLSSVVWIFALY